LEQHKYIAIIDFIVLAAMAALSLMPLFGLNISGIAVIVGLVYFFVQRRVRKMPKEESGLCFKCIPKAFKKKSIWLWIALPLAIDVISLVLAKAVAPGFLAHVYERSASVISYNDVPTLIFQVILFALGEEIAYRALFQGTLSRYLSAAPAIVITSAFFALAHLTQGSREIVIYDIVFVFLNSIVYGVIYHRTKNSYVSAISHILSNLFGAILILCM
jgi:uncharacterized protein